MGIDARGVGRDARRLAIRAAPATPRRCRGRCRALVRVSVVPMACRRRPGTPTPGPFANSLRRTGLVIRRLCAWRSASGATRRRRGCRVERAERGNGRAGPDRPTAVPGAHPADAAPLAAPVPSLAPRPPPRAAPRAAPGAHPSDPPLLAPFSPLPPTFPTAFAADAHAHARTDTAPRTPPLRPLPPRGATRSQVSARRALARGRRRPRRPRAQPSERRGSWMAYSRCEAKRQESIFFPPARPWTWSTSSNSGNLISRNSVHRSASSTRRDGRDEADDTLKTPGLQGRRQHHAARRRIRLRHKHQDFHER